MGRAPCCDKANVKKGPWSPEEDKQLKDYIEKHGTGGNWIALPQKAGLRRCGKSCRLRWLNYLRPNIKHGDFSDEEDRIICSLFASIGSRWSIIAAQLPGRTDNDIKNYWNTKLKKKLLGLPPSHRKSHQVKKHQLEEQQQQQLQLPQFFNPNSVDLEGIGIPMLSAHFPTSFIPPLPNLIAFGGEQQSCSSSVGLESYLHGSDLESGGGEGGMTGCNFGEVKPAAAEACPIADVACFNGKNSSTAAVAAAGMDMSCCFRNLARAMYHC